MSSRRPYSTMHNVEKGEFLGTLQKKYPYISKERLADLQGADATDAQYQRANETSRRETDNQLRSYVLQSNVGYSFGSSTQISGLCVAVIGCSGAGKSATGNTLLQVDEFRVSASATATTMSETISCSQHSGLRVVDTPGSWNLPQDRIDLYVLVINLASPRFHREDLNRLKNLKDYNYILRSRRCILLLTHARDALLGRSMESYLQEIRGDPLYDLIMNEVGRDKVMAINNDCLTRYEAHSQWKMITSLLSRARTDAVYAPSTPSSVYCSEPNLRMIMGVILVVGFLGVVYYYTQVKVQKEANEFRPL